MGPLGRNVHDAAALFESLRHFLHRKVGTLGVQGDDLIEISLGRLHEELRYEPPGIVDENIESAELLHRFDHKAAHLCDAAHVRLDSDGFPALGLNARYDLLSFLRTRSVIHHDDRPVFGQTRSAIARPIPLDDPVTIATFPLSDAMLCPVPLYMRLLRRSVLMSCFAIKPSGNDERPSLEQAPSSISYLTVKRDRLYP